MKKRFFFINYIFLFIFLASEAIGPRGKKIIIGSTITGGIVVTLFGIRCYYEANSMNSEIEEKEEEFLTHHSNNIQRSFNGGQDNNKKQEDELTQVKNELAAEENRRAMIEENIRTITQSITEKEKIKLIANEISCAQHEEALRVKVSLLEKERELLVSREQSLFAENNKRMMEIFDKKKLLAALNEENILLHGSFENISNVVNNLLEEKKGIEQEISKKISDNLKSLLRNQQQRVAIALFYANEYRDIPLQSYHNWITIMTDSDSNSDIGAVINDFEHFVTNHKDLITLGWKKRAHVFKNATSLEGLRGSERIVLPSSCDNGVTWEVWKMFSYLDTLYDPELYYRTMDEAHKIGVFSQILFGHALVNDPRYQGEMQWERELLCLSQERYIQHKQGASLVGQPLPSFVTVNYLQECMNASGISANFLEETFNKSYSLLHSGLVKDLVIGNKFINSIHALYEHFKGHNITLDTQSYYELKNNELLRVEENKNNDVFNEVFTEVNSAVRAYTPMVYFTTAATKNIFMTSDAHSTYVPLSVDKIIAGNSIQISCGDVHDRVPKAKDDKERVQIFQFSNFIMWWQQKCMTGMQFSLDNRVVFVPGNHEMMAANLSIHSIRDEDRYKANGIFSWELFDFLKQYGFYPMKELSKMCSIERTSFFINLLAPKEFVINNNGTLAVGHHGAWTPFLKKIPNHVNNSFLLCPRATNDDIVSYLEGNRNRIMQLFHSLPKDISFREVVDNTFIIYDDKGNRKLSTSFHEYMGNLPELWCDFNYSPGFNDNFFLRGSESGRMTIHQELLKMLSYESLNFFFGDHDFNVLGKKIALLVGHSQDATTERYVGFVNYMNQVLGMPFSLGSFESFHRGVFSYPFYQSPLVSYSEYLDAKILEKLLIFIKRKRNDNKAFSNEPFSINLVMVSSGAACGYMVDHITAKNKNGFALIKSKFNTIASLVPIPTIDAIKKRIGELYDNFLEMIQTERIKICTQIPFILSVEDNDFDLFHSLSLATFHPPFLTKPPLLPVLDLTHLDMNTLVDKIITFDKNHIISASSQKQGGLSERTEVGMQQQVAQEHEKIPQEHPGTIVSDITVPKKPIIPSMQQENIPLPPGGDMTSEYLKQAINNSNMNVDELMFLPYERKTSLEEIQLQILGESALGIFRQICSFFYPNELNKTISWNLFKYIYENMPQSKDFYDEQTAYGNKGSAFTFLKVFFFTFVLAMKQI